MIIESGILKEDRLIDLCRPLGHRFAIISDERTASLYGLSLLERFQACGAIAHLFTFPSGEKSKTREVKQQLEDGLLREGYGADSCVIALGGGVVSDVAGFLASTFCRGISLVLIPTTLLAMVDACIGGKNGVNACGIKNIIGTLYPPRAIFIDPDLVKEMPPSLLKEGRVEMLKHGLIADRELFFSLYDHPEEIPNLDRIRRNIAIKQAIVRRGTRDMLNFGHTVGHALESVHPLSHGEAVLAGMVAEAWISETLGLLAREEFEVIRKIFEPLPFSLDGEELIRRMRSDKKNRQGSICMALIKDIGVCEPAAHPVDETLILESLHYAGRLSEEISRCC